MRVTGCDDPAVWTAPALHQARFYSGIERCAWAEYPLSSARIDWQLDGVPLSDEELAQMYAGTQCWRVVDATPGSGWSAGQQFARRATANNNVGMMGFDRSVTFEGRVLFADGTVAFATDARPVALHASNVIARDMGATIAVMTTSAWAEADAVILDGERIPTDPVLDGRYPKAFDVATTLNRTAEGVVLRRWRKDSDGIVTHTDLPLGQGTKARFVGFSSAVVLDQELILLSRGSELTVQQRIALGAEPLEAVSYWRGTLVHFDGSLVAYDDTTGDVIKRPVGDGLLFEPGLDSWPMFFDGRMFHALYVTHGVIEDTPSESFTVTDAELTALGTPVAVQHGIVFGTNGLVSAEAILTDQPGPRFASFADLVGDGQLGPISPDMNAYVIKHADGSAELYEAPHYGGCL